MEEFRRATFHPNVHAKVALYLPYVHVISDTDFINFYALILRETGKDVINLSAQRETMHT